MAVVDVQFLDARYGSEIRRFLTGRLRCANTAAMLAEATFSSLTSGEGGDAPGGLRRRLYTIAEALLEQHQDPARSDTVAQGASRAARSREQDRTLPLFLEHRAALIAYAQKIVGREGPAEDIVQDAWLRLQKAIKTGAPDHPTGYLYAIVRNLALDRRRQMQREQKLICKVDPESLEHQADAQAGVERSLISRDALDRVREAMDELPERTRLALEMHRFSGYKLREIAEALGVSPSFAHHLVAQGVEHCKKRLDEF